MSDIKTTEQHSRIVHRVIFDRVPLDVVENLFYAAIAVGWSADEDLYSCKNGVSLERLHELVSEVHKATESAIPVDPETGASKINEQRALDGICSDCGGPSKRWTKEEIKEVKDDLGMSDSEDFFDCCSECHVAYLPEDFHSRQVAKLPTTK